MTPMDGLLLVDKPMEWTSFDVVARVRGVIKHGTGTKKLKVGHTGTLDPLATGLLILTVGSYCKRAQEFSKLDKVYEVTMRLGATSTTGDEEGVKTIISEKIPTLEELETTVRSFVGDIQQVPPAYSAVKVDGQRAYKLARAGKEVILEPRRVTVHGISELSYTYPTVTFMVHVSSGTYVRALVEDMGKHLGTGAYMAGLRRTKIGAFSINDAIATERLTIEEIERHLTLV